MATEADISRSRPGYAYGVAVHSSGERREEKPTCDCPCHLADAPYPSQWFCSQCWSVPMRLTTKTDVEAVPYSHEQAIADGTANPQPNMVSVPDYYFITKGNNLDDAFPRRHFKTSEAAEKAVKKLNDEDAIASLNIPDSHRARFDRFRELRGDYFSWSYWDGEHHPLTRLPARPGKYAVEFYYEGESYWETREQLDQVVEAIVDGNVYRVVDLDTGAEVDFSRNVSVEFVS